MREGDWATSIDLSNAYFLILMHQIDRRCSVSLQRGNFPVSSSTLRLLTGSMGLHSNRERAVLSPAPQGCMPESLSRRLARLSKLQAIVREPHADAPRRDSPSGLFGKLPKSELSQSQSFPFSGWT